MSKTKDNQKKPIITVVQNKWVKRFCFTASLICSFYTGGKFIPPFMEGFNRAMLRDQFESKGLARIECNFEEARFTFSKRDFENGLGGMVNYAILQAIESTNRRCNYSYPGRPNPQPQERFLVPKK